VKEMFFVCGPPKCASSSLYNHLVKHPDIEMSRLKETRYFSHGSEEDVEAYFNMYFSDKHTALIRGEATPSYSFLPYAAEAIKKHFPSPKFIFSFRNPIDRAYSGWLMRKQIGHENLGFIDALKANRDQGIDFSEPYFKAMWLEEHNSWRSTKRRNIIRTYIEAGDYATIWSRYVDLFGEESCVKIYTEELHQHLDSKMQEICRFLGVNDFPFALENKKVNAFKKAKSPALLFALQNPLLGTLSKKTPVGLKDALSSLFFKRTEKPKMSSADRKFAFDVFVPMIERMEQLWAEDLSHWKQ
jgi:hypothetical protein